jgi:hypothetical protein
MVRSLRILILRLTDPITTLLVKDFLLLYYFLITKLAYSYTISLAVNTIVNTPRITIN